MLIVSRSYQNYQNRGSLSNQLTDGGRLGESVLGAQRREQIRSIWKRINKRAHGVCSAFSLLGGVHIGARALLDPKLIWFGYITRLSQWGGGGEFTRSNYFYLPSLSLEEGGGVNTLC
jgi:hypothetical protein